MAIEPLGSVMSMQAQTAAPKPVSASKSVAQVEKPEASADSTAQAEKVDRTISVVENAQSKGQSSNNTEQEQYNNEQIKKAVEKLNRNLMNSEAIFGIHEGTNRVTIKIVDKDTKEVLKELPPEKTLDMLEKVWELAGILVDERR